MGFRWCKGLTEELWRADFPVAGHAAAPASGAGDDSRYIATRKGVESTGVGGQRGEPIGDSLGEVVKGLAFSASMAEDLALVEDQ
jgi:hypothetical protein